MLSRLRTLGRNLFRKRIVERDLDDEAESSLDLIAQARIAAGVGPDAARRLARLEFGGATQVKEAVRAGRAGALIEDLIKDVLFAVRALLNAPVVTATAILSLALGIGANTAVFSAISAIVLQPLAYADPDRLVMISTVQRQEPDKRNAANGPEYWAWRTQSSLFDAVGTTSVGTNDLGSDENGAPAERIEVQGLTPSMFQILGVQPALGRAFQDEDAPIGAPAPIVLISDSLWARRFSRDRHVIGRTLRLDGAIQTIAGVMPPTFAYLDARRVDVWTPYNLNPRQLQGSARGFPVTARLKPGVTLLQAQAEIDGITAELDKNLPGRPSGWTARVEPLQRAVYGDLTRPLLLLWGVVGLVLLIACANVAGLLLARESARRTEIAIRTAIGASRGRIVRQLLTESVVLASIGGLIGVAVGWAALKAFIAVSPADLPRIDAVRIDTRVLGFTFVLSVLTGVLFGLVPTLQSSRLDLVESLRSTRGATVGRSHRLRGGLVVLQIALAFVLLVASGLMVKSLQSLKANDLGADPRGVVTFNISFSQTRFQKGVGTYRGFPLVEVSPIPSQSYERIWQALQVLPGVQSATGINVMPFSGGLPRWPFIPQGKPAPSTVEERQYLSARTAIVMPNYFATMSIPLVRGRDFSAADTATGVWGVVVNQAMAAKFWPDQDPIGQRLTLDLVEDEQPREVIGVTRNARLSPYELQAEPVMYILHAQQPVHGSGPNSWRRLTMDFLVKSNLDAAAIIPTLRHALADFDPDRPVAEVRLLEGSLSDQLRQPRYTASILGLFASIATLLAAVGIYGVIAFAVGQRTREIGIRLALGANRRDVLILVLRQVVILALVGVVLGLGAALPLTRLLSATLWGVTATDLPTYVIVSVLMTTVALLAGFVPTERAMRVAPTVALRQE